MIELVASLTMFVMVMGILYSLLHAATTLWTDANNGQKEIDTAERLLSTLEDDLTQAVTDNGSVTNMLHDTEGASFVCDSEIPAGADSAHIILRFARPASPRINLSGIDEERRLSLDAVFYTYYQYEVYRHVIPMEQQEEGAEPRALSELLEATQRETDFTAICQHLENDPTGEELTSEPGLHTCLARHVTYFSIYGSIPYEALLESLTASLGYTKPEEDRDKDHILLPDSDDYPIIWANTLPDRIDVELTIQKEAEWPRWLSLTNQEDWDARITASALGIRASRRITFMTKGASRLP